MNFGQIDWGITKLVPQVGFWIRLTGIGDTQRRFKSYGNRGGIWSYSCRLSNEGVGGSEYLIEINQII